MYYLMLLPSIVLLIIFAYQPMYGLVLAFKKYSPRLGITGSPFIGWANFQTLFGIDQFWTAFRNTIEINLLKLLFGFPASIILALQINSLHHSWFKKIIQTLLYLPHFVSWVVVAGLIFSILDERTGSLFRFFSSMGVELNPFGDGVQFRVLLISVDTWKEMGWGAIIYLAALSTINPDYYEAARIDGANALQQTWHITLPELVPTICILLIMRVGSLIGGGFDEIYNLYNTQVYDAADVLDTFIYRYGIGGGQFALGTAMGLFENVANLFLLLFANQFVSIVQRNAE